MRERTLRRLTIDGRPSVLLEPTSVPEPVYGIASGASTDGGVAEG
ncbi:hypothetical protein [Streptomyces sp. NPDC001401]